MKIYAQSIAKQDDHPCEDALLVRPTDSGLLLGLADGAGGEGLFAGEWAQHLLRYFPDRPITSYPAFQNWLNQLWHPFYEAFQPRAAALGAKHLEKFLEEGSASTLIMAWLKPDGQVHYLSYGDSRLLLYDRSKDTLVLDPWELAGCTLSPYLLNWSCEPEEKALTASQFHLGPDQYLLLASDAIGEFLLAAYLVARRQAPVYRHYLGKLLSEHNRFSYLISEMLKQQPDGPMVFSSIIEATINALENEITFRSFTANLRTKGLLDFDDYSLICLKYSDL